MRQDSRPPRGRSQRRLALLLAVFRAATLVFALQVAGIIHGASDVISVVLQLDQHQHEQCPDDGACNDCLAGCPNCHCANAMRLVVSGASAHLWLPPRLVSTARWASAADEQHPRPELASLYRPPRAAAPTT